MQMPFQPMSRADDGWQSWVVMMIDDLCLGSLAQHISSAHRLRCLSEMDSANKIKGHNPLRQNPSYKESLQLTKQDLGKWQLFTAFVFEDEVWDSMRNSKIHCSYSGWLSIYIYGEIQRTSLDKSIVTRSDRRSIKCVKVYRILNLKISILLKIQEIPWKNDFQNDLLAESKEYISSQVRIQPT